MQAPLPKHFTPATFYPPQPASPNQPLSTSGLSDGGLYEGGSSGGVSPTQLNLGSLTSPGGTHASQTASPTGYGTSTGKPAPWLLPWQTGDREKGALMAKAIRSKRTPIGSFANLDLAKGR